MLLTKYILKKYVKIPLQDLESESLNVLKLIVVDITFG